MNIADDCRTHSELFLEFGSSEKWSNRTSGRLNKRTIENDAIAKPSNARLALATGPQSISQHVVEFVDTVNFLASRFKIVLDPPKE